MFAASKTDGAVAAAQADPFFNYVAALLNTSGTNGAQNNTFIDSSTNNFTITRNGNTTQGSFSPYGEDWSNYFDGSGDFLSLPNNSVFSQTGAWTLECWVFPTVAQNNYVYSQVTTNFLQINISASMFINIDRSGVGNLIVSANPISLNVWTHIALVSDGTNMKLFINGSQSGSTAGVGTQATSATTTTIGAYQSGGTLAYAGYISNFRLVKGSALYTTTFTPSAVPLQPIAGTGLLTCKDPNIVDDSVNNFTITRNGDVSVQKFGPFPGIAPATLYYGGYFSGNSSQIEIFDSPVFTLGSGNFTIEYWVNTAQIGTVAFLYGQMNSAASASSRNVYDTLNAAGKIETQFFSGNVSLGSIVSTTTLAVGTWYHVAVVRNGTVATQYINGVSTGTLSLGTSALNDSSSNFAIGALGEYSLNRFSGGISNFRFVKGQALYTSDFTPSTVPLTTTSQGAVASNVSLLTCQSPTYVDNSPNNLTLLFGSNPRPAAFAPFAVTYTSLQPYTPAVFGGSGYFDGTGDWLSVPANPALALGTGNFTVEWWYFPLDSGTVRYLFDIFDNNSSGRFLIQQNSDMSIGFYGSSAATRSVSSANALVRNTWNHIAICRSSGITRIFSNGIQVNTNYSDSTNYTFTTTFLYWGTQNAGNTQNALGYCNDLRIVKGTALYISNFVPQNTPLTAVTNTSLLLNATNAGIYDAATLNDFETVGNAQVSTSVKRYGTSSIAFDGTGDNLTIPSTVLYSFGTGDFTVECWANFNSLGGVNYAPIFANAFLFYVGKDGEMLLFNGTSNVATGTNGSVVTGTWHYLAWTRASNTVRMFVNGVQTGTNATVSASIGSGSPNLIGQYTTVNLNAYIQDLRITRGIARYTTNFTPPAAPLPTF